MRRVLFALLALAASSRMASAAAISVAGADCGTPPLLGLTFSAGLLGTNISTSGVACPADNVGLGAILGPGNSGGQTGLYGPSITSLTIDISNPQQLGTQPSLDILRGSELRTVTFTPTGFILSDKTGIQIGCTFPVLTEGNGGDAVCSPRDALITFSGFAPDTLFTVSAVNDIPAVPEPATLTLLGSGLAAAALRRRVRGRLR